MRSGIAVADSAVFFAETVIGCIETGIGEVDEFIIGTDQSNIA